MDSSKLIIRPYRPADCPELLGLFFDTVHTVNARDYSPEQLDAWAGGRPDTEAWGRSLSEHFTLVAETSGITAGTWTGSMCIKTSRVWA